MRVIQYRKPVTLASQAVSICKHLIIRSILAAKWSILPKNGISGCVSLASHPFFSVSQIRYSGTKAMQNCFW